MKVIIDVGQVSGGISEIQSKVNEIRSKVNQEVVSRGSRATNAMRNTALRVLANPAPAPPGSPPGARSNNLRKHWNQQVKASGGGGGGVGITAIIESGMPYAGYLEHGTSKMAARPFVDKIAEESAPEVAKIYSNLI